MRAMVCHSMPWYAIACPRLWRYAEAAIKKCFFDQLCFAQNSMCLSINYRYGSDLI
jgi:hypothetical protein